MTQAADGQTGDRARYELEELVATSRALSSERDIRKLLAVILEKRRQVSLRATERLVALLTQLNSEPSLREVVQTTLGPTGRARVGQGIRESFRSVPDAKQRERAMRLWSEVEASARVKR